MSKYRFKTEEEFKRDGLWNNDHPNMWTSSGTMNSYLGKDIPDKYNRFCDVNKDFSYEGWCFSNDDYVLKESSVVESPKGMDMKAVQEEAKKRFPIGCKFIPVSSSNTYTLKKDSYTYTIHSKQIYAHDCHETLYDNGKWATLVSFPESKEESIPEYVECVRKLNNATIGKIYRVIDDNNCESNSPTQKYSWKTSDYIPSTKEAYEAQNAPKQLTKKDLVKGEIYIYDGTQIATYPEGPNLSINRESYTSNPKWTWSLPITHATEEQKVLLRREIEKKDKKTVIEEWSEGTYAVGLKGNFGIYKESDNLVPVGRIFTIKENRKDTLVVKDHGFWIYKENLRWFATYQEALNFSNQLKASPVPKESDYPVMPVDAYPSIKKETFIDNVQSVDVILRTKKKSIKF